MTHRAATGSARVGVFRILEERCKAGTRSSKIIILIIIIIIIVIILSFEKEYFVMTEVANIRVSVARCLSTYIHLEEGETSLSESCLEVKGNGSIIEF